MAEPPARARRRGRWALLEEFRPDTVIAFDSHGITRHPDHCAVATWADLTVSRCERPPRLLVAKRESGYCTDLALLDEQRPAHMDPIAPEARALADRWPASRRWRRFGQPGCRDR